MKKYYAAILLLAAFLSGCVRPDQSGCQVNDNFVLKFTLTAKDGSGNIIAEKLNSIDVVVYDADHHFVLHRRVPGEMLEQGIALTVDPGEYRVVCWGNISSNTQMSALEASTFGASYLQTVSDASGCPLYYAPEKSIGEQTRAATQTETDYSIYTVIVPPNKVTEKEMVFTRAHRTAHVYVKGLTDEQDNPVTPVVRICNIPHSVNFFLQTLGGRKSYEKQGEEVTTPRGEMHLSSINAPICGFSNDMRVDIVRSSDGSVAHSINLKEYVEANAAKIDDMNDISIYVSFSTNDVIVNVNVPDWQGGTVKPGWGNK